jgi:dTDP-glucose pyrophosphorylase
MRVVFVLTLAGEGYRFKSDGYKGEKFLLPVGGKLVLELILAQMAIPHFFEKLIIVRREQVQSYQGGILQNIADVFNFRVIEIDSTQSQYCTLVKGLKVARLTSYDALFVHNGDTIIHRIDLGSIAKRMIQSNAGYVDSFKANTADFSYLVCSKIWDVLEIQEKKVISKTASTGLYGFPGNLALNCCANFESRYTDRHEIFISDVINTLIKSNRGRFFTFDRGEASAQVLGTPAQYEAHTRKLK